MSRTLRIALESVERSQPDTRQLQRAMKAAVMPDTRDFQEVMKAAVMPDTRDFQEVMKAAVTPDTRDFQEAMKAAVMPDTRHFQEAMKAAVMPDTRALQRAIEAAAQVDTRALRSAVEAAAQVDTRALHQMVESMTDLQEQRGALEELSFDATALESEEGSLDSTEETDTGSPSLGEVRTRVLLIMFVLWVTVTPYLSAQQMAEFVGWWVEVVAALLSGS